MSNNSEKSIVLPLRFSNLDQVYKSYMPLFKNGGLFIPTRSGYVLGQALLMVIELPDNQEKIQAKGIVCWVTPKNAAGHKKQGIGVEFSDEKGIALRHRIDGLLKGSMDSGVPSYTL